MAERISVPAVVTSIIATVTCLAAFVTTFFLVGQRWGSVLRELELANWRLATIERRLDTAAEERESNTQWRLRMESRVNLLERGGLGVVEGPHR